MKLSLTVVLVLFLLPTPNAATSLDFALKNPRNKGLFRFEINNDAVWDRDSNFSNGWSLQYHTVRYADWDQTKAPALFKWIGNHVPTLDNPDGIVRYGHGIGQNMLTPADLSTRHPSEGDLPYAGTLTYTLNWQNFNRRCARIFQVNLGVLGEEAYAEEVQTWVHEDLLGADEPMGWDSQRDTEPIVNLAYTAGLRLGAWGHYTNDWAAQVVLSPAVHLGNLLTGAELGLALRFGWNIQEGFSAYPEPPGRGIFQSAYLPKPRNSSPHGIEFIMGVRATGLLYSVIYDGSIITDDDRSVEREYLIYAGGGGIQYHYHDYFSIRFMLLYNSDILDTDALPQSGTTADKTSADNSYGTLIIDVNF